MHPFRSFVLGSHLLSLSSYAPQSFFRNNVYPLSSLQVPTASFPTPPPPPSSASFFLILREPITRLLYTLHEVTELIPTPIC